MLASNPVELFHQTFFRSVSQWMTITAFRRVYDAALMQISLRDQDIDVAQEMAADFRHAGVTADFIHNYRSDITKLAITSAAGAVNAATVVFAHSILDGIAYDYCRVSASLDPLAWADKVNNRHVTVAEVAQRPFSDILYESLGEYVDQLSQESLLEKIHCFSDSCWPISTPSNWTRGSS